jgi:hypothetical protein
MQIQGVACCIPLFDVRRETVLPLLNFVSYTLQHWPNLSNPLIDKRKMGLIWSLATLNLR